jgi:hypothetical protein
LNFTSINIDPAQLLTKQDALDKLRENGGAYSALARIADHYFGLFENELYWHYPLCGESAGAFILPVQEGFLHLPYNEVDAQRHELLDLDRASMLNADDVKAMLDEWRSYSDAFVGALTDMASILKKQHKTQKTH